MNIVNILTYKIDREYIKDNYDILLESLYPQRKEAVLGFNNKKAAYTSLSAGIVLMEAYKRVYGVNGQNIVIEKGEYGKPYIVRKKEFKFNISHSGDYAVIAYSTDEEVSSLGIDIERVRSKDSDMMVAHRFFTKDEIEYISNGLECSDEDVRFYKIWTMKEAYIKMTGKGLSTRLDSFSVYPDELKISGVFSSDKIYDTDNLYKNLKSNIKIIGEYIVTVCAGCIGEIKFIYDKYA
ncbi:MAG: 4'-phosphopantetheinyl transferase superfamily protein [Lachnospiraceae bacterium]|nr:4'-phosphopantetheinyl transferase superfamily protein [Lachnospiraceae bacterium]